ncbi:MAG: acylphosphatase [Candidatus Paceibacterota bacterium]|jgi:acylphosphatase
MKTIYIKISGRVQGVFFRVEARRKALECGVSGSARNMPDGTVEIMASGEEKNLKELLEWCYNGPTGANVERVEYEWLKKGKTFDNFEIM